MKVVEKITLFIYSNIMLILSIILCLLVFGWLDMELVGGIVRKLIVGDLSGKIILGVSVLFILLSIKCIFFSVEKLKLILELLTILTFDKSIPVYQYALTGEYITSYTSAAEAGRALGY